MYKILNTVDDVSRYTARRLFDQICAKADSVLGLATGSTMEPVYARLMQYLEQDPVDVSRLTTFNLDEYIGLGPEHAQSYCFYMYQHLFNQLRIPGERVHLPDGTAENAERACQAYTEAIQAIGGMDLQLLGIGTNGHIGFNEPKTPFDSRTHVIELTEQTRIDNGRFFTDQREVPTHAITMGIQEILEAKEVILVATGPKKAAIMAELYHGEVSEDLPASVLKMHRNATIVMDKEAAALLPKKEGLVAGA